MPPRLEATIERNWEVLDELSTRLAYRPNSVVPFVGAGLSRPYGMPAWSEFLEDLIEFHERRVGHSSIISTKELLGLLREGQFELLAQWLVRSLGESEFRTKLQTTFQLRRRVTDGAVTKVISLTDGLVITTNYDRVVESAWASQMSQSGDIRTVTPVVAKSRADAIRALTGVSPTVLKLHGDVENPESWVLTEESYRDLYENAEFILALNQFLSSRVPLFVGCSMTEERIVSAMRTVGCVGYAILPLNSADRRRLHVSSMLDGTVRIIWLDPSDVREKETVYDLVEPTLEWLCARRQFGRIDWSAEPQRLDPWASALKDLHDAGKYRDGMKWIESHWPAHRSWELAVEYLRFSDVAAYPAGWDRFKVLRDELVPQIPVTIAQAIAYHHARLMGQAGAWSHAINLHRANQPRPPVSSRAQAMSWFEIGQLRFRTEDFPESQRVLDQLYSLLQNEDCDDAILIDVTKFLAAIAVIDAIYDLPGSEYVWVKGRHANATEALLLAGFARSRAQRHGYSDAVAWSWIVEAFAHEAAKNSVLAAEAYEKASHVIRECACRASTPFHLRVYRAGFTRRSGRLEEARELLNEAERLMVRPHRAPDRLRLAEQRLLVAHAEGDKPAQRGALKLIRNLDRTSQQMLDGSTTIEKRLRYLRGWQ